MTAQHEHDSPPTLRRTPKTPRMRPVAFYDARHGLLTAQDGCSYHFDRHAPLSGILERLAAIRGATAPTACVLYVVAGTGAEDSRRRGLTPEWYKQAADGGWTVEYSHDSNAGRRTAKCTRDGLTVDVRHTAAWFGDYTASVSEMRTAMHTILSRLRLCSQWGAAVLLGTPAQTGQLLLDLSVPHKREYPTLPSDVRELLYSQMPQARREVFPPRDGATVVPGMVEYDARLAYVACMRRVPCWLDEHGTIEHREASRYVDGKYLRFRPFVPAFYRTSWQVPRDWSQGIGILPEKSGAENWEWPHAPGSWHHSWASGQELHHAQQWGWTFHVHEALYFAPGNTPGADPLDYVQDNISTLYLRTTDDVYGAVQASLQRAMLRSIALGLIGSFHRRSNVQTTIYPEHTPWDVLTAGALHTPRRIDAGYEVERRRELSPHALRYAHPEWSQGIWSAQRYRLGVLMLGTPSTGGAEGRAGKPGIPRDELLGCNTDSVATTTLQPQIRDGGRIGDYRVKGYIPEAVDAPRDLDELARLAHAARVRYAELGRGAA